MTDVELSEDEFQRFCALIYRTAGVRIPGNKRVMITNRLRRRLRATGIGGFSEYLALLSSSRGAAELPQFLDEVTTHETYFFRDIHHFEWFGGTFLPEVIQAARLRKRPRSLKVWSAACSTGEEIYSMALRLVEHRPALSGWEILLLGSDLSLASLEAARAGRYDARSLRLVGQEDRQRGFDHDTDAARWTVKPELRSMATFKMHNLLQPIREGPFDCVFIKNVLIYFDLASKKSAVKHLISALAPGGYLVVGPTEGIFSMLDPLEKLKPWLYRKPS